MAVDKDKKLTLGCRSKFSPSAGILQIKVGLPRAGPCSPAGRGGNQLAAPHGQARKMRAIRWPCETQALDAKL